MREFHKIWLDQCDAARDIRDAFGVEKALGYLVGEKLLKFLRAADRDAAFAGEIPAFVAEIDIRENRNLSALGDQEPSSYPGGGCRMPARSMDPVERAQTIRLIEHTKTMLLRHGT